MSFTWRSGFDERDTEYYAAVGFLCHQWNGVEHFVYGLASDAMQLERRFHGILFRHLGIKAVQTFIEDYAIEHLEAETLAQIRHVNAYVDRCRINRNTIVHGLPTSDPQSGQPMVRAPADRNRRTARNYPISVNAIRQVCDECEIAGLQLIQLQFLVMPDEKRAEFLENHIWGPGWEQSLHLKQPLPELLVANPHESPTP